MSKRKFKRHQQRHPFAGQLMTCAICKKKEQSDPQVESGWTAIDLDKTRYYVCPDHFPHDAPAEQYQIAHVNVLRALMVKHQERVS